jgi:DNA polymerase I-like protein with 3'-5' exonuclease and polymerase domains
VSCEEGGSYTTIIIWDCETTTKNKGGAFTKSNKMVSYSIKRNDEKPSFHYYTDLDFVTALREGYEVAKWIVGFNLKFESHWARRLGVMPSDGVRIWDCQIAEFILRGQRGSYPSLNEACARFDIGQKDDKIAEYWALGVDTPEIPVDELRVYNVLDVDLTYKLYLAQQKAMTDKQKKLCTVMGLDLLVLAEMEWNGIKLDVDLCKQKAKETDIELQKINKELLQFSPTPDINLDSGHQLSCLLYGGGFEITTVDHVTQEVYKSGKRKGQPYEKAYYVTRAFKCTGLFEPLKGTRTKLFSSVGDIQHPVYQTGEQVLKQLKKPTKQHRKIIELLLKRAEYAKLLDTYYLSLPQLIEDMDWSAGMLHPQYNQTVARTGRLSSSQPNAQNFSGDVDQLLVSRYV